MEGNGGECVPVQLVEPSIKSHLSCAFQLEDRMLKNCQVHKASPPNIRQRRSRGTWIYPGFHAGTSCLILSHHVTDFMYVCVCLFLSGLSTSHRSSRINRDKVQKDAEGPNTCHPHSHSHLACKVLRLSISCGLSSVSGSHGTNLQAAGCHRLRS